MMSSKGKVIESILNRRSTELMSDMIQMTERKQLIRLRNRLRVRLTFLQR